ncbi:ATP-binding protein [Bradyrhizobium sp. CCBAU 11357]|uniref:ATP-binding protein n=1 Tax=Bradyrhizobium sp. CCBAU 11357 TaxID=1630808 RepID=UPI0023024000|nr:ATP-binding protein [Bradyrhizobium sp. CCBAU 11357]
MGSFVRIPQGYHDLYGIISQVGATATPEAVENLSLRGDRWLTVQLVGEIVEAAFERGISQYPGINDEVHLVTEEDLGKIYGTKERGQITIGRLAGAESISAQIDLDRLITRHSAVLGSTGSGKSTTVTSLLRAIVGNSQEAAEYSNARILILDIHGEYSSALSSVAKVFRVSPLQGEEKLVVPYWALDTGALFAFLMGKLEDKAFAGIMDKVFSEKSVILAREKFLGADPNAITADSPLPFSLRKLWLDLLDPEIKTWADQAKTTPALVSAGDANTLLAPVYKPVAAGSALPTANVVGVLSIRRQLSQLRSRLLDRRYDFLLHPGPWEPDLDGKIGKDLSDLLAEWLGHDKPITVLDLSGVPSSVLMQLIGSILNIIYEALFWGRYMPEGGRSRPQLVVMEEAHRYLGKDADGFARDMVQRIVKEGRKFGVGAMIVSQRPSEIDDTILSQCGTFVALRLSNAADRARVQSTLPDSLSGLVDSLPVLRTGEAIVTGEAAKLPVRLRINLPPVEARPGSEDPHVAEAWSEQRKPENYVRLSAAWRSQNPGWQSDEAGE